MPQIVAYLFSFNSKFSDTHEMMLGVGTMLAVGDAGGENDFVLGIPRVAGRLPRISLAPHLHLLKAS